MLHSQLRVEQKMFADRQCPDEDVLLLHEDGVVGHLLLIYFMTIDHDFPADAERASVLEVEDVEQRRLSGTGCSHQRHEASRVDDPLDVGEDVLRREHVFADALLDGFDSDAAP